MDRELRPVEDREVQDPSDKTAIEQANIRMDRAFYESEDIEYPEETTTPFINRNQS